MKVDRSVAKSNMKINDKKRREIILIKVGITSQEQLQIVENEENMMYYSMKSEEI